MTTRIRNVVMLWFGLPLLSIWAVKPPNTCTWGWVWSAGGSWGVTEVPERDHRRAAYREMTSLNPDVSRPQSPPEWKLCTELHWHVFGREEGSWSHCLFLQPQSHVCPPKRGVKVCGAISVRPHASPLTSYRGNINLFGWFRLRPSKPPLEQNGRK